MEMPKPNEHHAKLAALAGSWQGEETLQPSPFGEGGPAVGRYDNHIRCDGWILTQDYVQERGGEAGYAGHGVYGYDTQRESYTMFWSDNMTGMPPAVVFGRMEGNELVFVNEGPQGHARYIYTFHDDGSFSFRLDTSQDGENWTNFMEGRYRKS